jgi:hypothetical protein
LPVDFTDDVFEALDLQDELQCKYTGGTVFHTFVGEKMTVDSVKRMVKKIAFGYHLPYFTISPTFSICPIHGYLAGEHEFCPKCDLEIAEGDHSGGDDVVSDEEDARRFELVGGIAEDSKVGEDETASCSEECENIPHKIEGSSTHSLSREDLKSGEELRGDNEDVERVFEARVEVGQGDDAPKKNEGIASHASLSISRENLEGNDRGNGVEEVKKKVSAFGSELKSGGDDDGCDDED